MKKLTILLISLMIFMSCTQVYDTSETIHYATASFSILAIDNISLEQVRLRYEVINDCQYTIEYYRLEVIVETNISTHTYEVGGNFIKPYTSRIDWGYISYDGTLISITLGNHWLVNNNNGI